MTRVNMIYPRLVPQDGTPRVTVGGVQTYIQRLSKLFANLGFVPILYQQAEKNFELSLGPLRIRGVPPKDAPISLLHKFAWKEDGSQNPIILFCAYQCSCRSRSKRSILIQHGIHWDLPTRFWASRKMYQWPILRTWYKYYAILANKRLFCNARYRVCVDPNFINWYRTVCELEDESNIFCIPNCCNPLSEDEMQSKLKSSDNHVTILFARRFIEPRGTRIFGPASARLVKEFPNVRVVIAGEGPDEEYLRRQSHQTDNVSIRRVSLDEMPSLLKSVDVAVAPSLASEGTSFSLAEAMGAACAVIASNVGGMTNMVIDNHNGLLIWPRVEDCFLAMRDLVLNAEKRVRLARTAWETARIAFSEDLWFERWRKVMAKVID